MGLVQGITTGVTASNAAKDQRRASNELTRRMEASRLAYQQRRPQVAQERQQALKNQLGLFNPANSMLGEMSGGKYQLDMQPLQKSPLNMKATEADILGTRSNTRIGDAAGADAASLKALKAQGYDVGQFEGQVARGTARDRQMYNPDGSAKTGPYAKKPGAR